MLYMSDTYIHQLYVYKNILNMYRFVLFLLIEIDAYRFLNVLIKLKEKSSF